MGNTVRLLMLACPVLFAVFVAHPNQVLKVFPDLAKEASIDDTVAKMVAAAKDAAKDAMTTDTQKADRRP
jgi:hypothetical protein